MPSRLDLHSELKAIIGNNNVYFQPPESLKLNYPAIIYSRDGIYNRNANNEVYTQRVRYQITVIDKNPDSIIVAAVSRIPSIRFVRHFNANGLNHDVFTLIYYY